MKRTPDKPVMVTIMNTSENTKLTPKDTEQKKTAADAKETQKDGKNDKKATVREPEGRRSRQEIRGYNGRRRGRSQRGRAVQAPRIHQPHAGKRVVFSLHRRADLLKDHQRRGCGGKF